MPEWISVNDQLPDSDIIVIVHLPHLSEPVWLAYHDGDEWRDVSNWSMRDTVTHWQPLPAPPEQDTAQD